MNVPKKVAAIHDIAGFGRSSLTVVIPVMSVMGHQTCPVPTAVLSTITGFYEGFVFKDLTDILPDYLAHWQKENVHFDCIYTGFLGSPEQSKIAGSFIDSLSAPLVVVDPVFSDDGTMYSCFDSKMVDSMRELIKKADVITPNVTEAAFLLGETDFSPSLDKAKDYAKRLAEKADCSVIITSVAENEKSVSVVIYNKHTCVCSHVSNPYINARYPGTGDLFTSVFTGAHMKGMSIEDSTAKAAAFVSDSMALAAQNKVPAREGVPLEYMLSKLI